MKHNFNFFLGGGGGGGGGGEKKNKFLKKVTIIKAYMIRNAIKIYQ